MIVASENHGLLQEDRQPAVLPRPQKISRAEIIRTRQDTLLDVHTAEKSTRIRRLTLRNMGILNHTYYPQPTTFKPVQATDKNDDAGNIQKIP